MRVMYPYPKSDLFNLIYPNSILQKLKMTRLICQIRTKWVKWVEMSYMNLVRLINESTLIHLLKGWHSFTQNLIILGWVCKLGWGFDSSGHFHEHYALWLALKIKTTDYGLERKRNNVSSRLELKINNNFRRFFRVLK